MDRAAPYLIHQESSVLVHSHISDYMRGDIDEIILDDPEHFEEAHAYMKQVRPELADRVKLYQDKQPLFSRYQIESQIESSLHEVRLSSGGSIVIDQTEALVAIDVNSSRATRGKSIEETAFNTNLEAAREVILVNYVYVTLGGLIIVDFIDMNHQLSCQLKR